MSLSSCLSPQTIEELEESPRVPPEIDANSITPDTKVVCLDSTTQKVFSLTVRAPDGRPLEARWFVDYDVNVSSTTAIRSVSTIDFSEDEELPARRVDFEQADLGLLPQTDNPHTIEVVIATAFNEDTRAFPRNRALAEGAYAVSFKWVVESQERCTQ